MIVGSLKILITFQAEEERAAKESSSPTKLPPVIEAQEPPEEEAKKAATEAPAEEAPAAQEAPAQEAPPQEEEKPSDTSEEKKVYPIVRLELPDLTPHIVPGVVRASTSQTELDVIRASTS